jgi:hypothetical protein
MTRIGATVDGPGDERAQIREAVAREFSPKEALDFLVTVGEHTVFQEKDIDKEIRSAGISSKVIDRPLRQAWVTSKLRNVDLRTAAIHHQEIKRRAWDLETRPGITPADLKAFRDEVREAARDPRFKRTLRQAMVDLDQTAVRNLESWHPSIVRDVQTALELQRFAKICPSHSDKSPAKDWYFIEVAGSTADAAEPGRKALRVRAGNEFTPERALEFANAVQDVAINRKAALNKELRQNRLIKPKHRGVFGDPPAKKAALREIWLVAGKFGMDFKTAAMFYQEIQRRAWDREGPQREPLQQGKRRESFVRGF